MTCQAERANVFKVAFAPAFADRQNMVRIPEAFAGHGFQSPIIQHQFSTGAAGALQSSECFQRVDMAERAATSVAGKHSLAKIAWIGAQAPFMDAPVGAKCQSAWRNFQRTPAAQRASAASLRKQGANGTSAGHGSLRTHGNKQPSLLFDPRLLWT